MFQVNYNADDIRNQEFHLFFRGYKPQEVEEFLDKIAEDYVMVADYEELVLEKKELEETVDKLREKVRYLEATSL